MAILGLVNDATGAGIADADARYINLSAVASPANTITASGATVKPLVVKGASAQTANLFEAQNSAGTVAFAVRSGGAVLIQPIASTGTPPNGLQFVPAAHTALTASTEFRAIYIDGDAVVQQFATGALTTQRFMFIDPPTYAFVGASTITNCATLCVEGPPTAGTNCTITNAYAFWVENGITKLQAIQGTTLSLSGQLTSTLAIGTAPLAVTSTTVCTNLNADTVDGSHASSFAPALVSVPASATAAGTAGTMAYDTEYMYVCVATNTWKRHQLVTW